MAPYETQYSEAGDEKRNHADDVQIQALRTLLSTILHTDYFVHIKHIRGVPKTHFSANSTLSEISFKSNDCETTAPPTKSFTNCTRDCALDEPIVARIN